MNPLRKRRGPLGSPNLLETIESVSSDIFTFDIIFLER